MWLSKLLKQTESSMHGARKIHTAFLRDDVAVLCFNYIHPGKLEKSQGMLLPVPAAFMIMVTLI